MLGVWPAARVIGLKQFRFAGWSRQVELPQNLALTLGLACQALLRSAL